jgi:hypothetical protein
MLNSFIKIVNGYRVRFYRVTFCIGISIDQITPEYYRFKNYRIIGSLKQEIINHQKEKEVKNIKENSKSLQTKNYNKRAKNKH